MPDNQPSSATDLPPDARDDATAAAVLHDETGDARGSAAPRGTSPNAPIDTGVGSGDAGASGEARLLAATDEAEAHPS